MTEKKEGRREERKRKVQRMAGDFKNHRDT